MEKNLFLSLHLLHEERDSATMPNAKTLQMCYLLPLRTFYWLEKSEMIHRPTLLIQ